MINVRVRRRLLLSSSQRNLDPPRPVDATGRPDHSSPGRLPADVQVYVGVDPSVDDFLKKIDRDDNRTALFGEGEKRGTSRFLASEQVHWAVIERTRAVVAMSVAVLALAALAALGTVFLVFASRGATIRRVNATLLEISERLRPLKQSGPH